jgi:hypothetical protein
VVALLADLEVTMWLTRASAFMGVFLLTCSAALAQTMETTPIPMAPKPDFSKMQFQTGNWTCSIKSSRRPSAFKTTATARISDDGYWLITRTTTQKMPWMSASLTGEDRITYDPSTSRWVDISYDEQGGYDLSTSPGWSGNTITWTDVTYPKTNATAVNNPTTITKVSNTRTTSKNTFKEPSGRLVTVTGTCNKTS